jgi:hypothetical protein
MICAPLQNSAPQARLSAYIGMQVLCHPYPKEENQAQVSVIAREFKAGSGGGFIGKFRIPESVYGSETIGVRWWTVRVI